MPIVRALLSLFILVSVGTYFARHPEQPFVISLFLRLSICMAGALTWKLLGQAMKKTAVSHSYGSAAFARKEEIADLIKPARWALKPGEILLGEHHRHRVILSPPLTTQHGIIVGGSGTGKSYSFFLPNMALSKGVSCVVTDPKNELWTFTSGYHASTRYAPTDPEESACFNWIPLCENARLASLCARAIVEAGDTERQEAPWPDLETAFLAALFSHTSTLSAPTPLTAYRLLTRSDPKELMGMFLSSASWVAREQAVIFEQTHERMRGSITPVLAAKLQFMREESVVRFTSASFEKPAFGRLQRSPQALYWCVREQDMALLRPLSALFFTILLEQLAQNQETPKVDTIPVHLYLDEFPNVGVIPHYDTTISLARGRGVSLWHGIQSLSQLEARYGRANAQTILTNCSTKIALCGLDVETARYFSRSLGETTITIKRRSHQKRRFDLWTRSVSDSVMEHARALLTPDEVRRIGRDQALVITGNRAPLLIDKYRFEGKPHEAFMTPLGVARSLEVEGLWATKQKEPLPVPAASAPPSLPKALLSANPKAKRSAKRASARTTLILKNQNKMGRK